MIIWHSETHGRLLIQKDGIYSILLTHDGGIHSILLIQVGGKHGILLIQNSCKHGILLRQNSSLLIKDCGTQANLFRQNTGTYGIL